MSICRCSTTGCISQFSLSNRATTARSLGSSLVSLINPRGPPRATRNHALLQRCPPDLGGSELPASHWLAAPKDIATLAIARRRDDGNAGAWLQAHSSGQILVCALAAAFSNAQITRADNARLLANIISWSRAARRTRAVR